METIELKDVMNQLPVVENLKNFAGIDAQNALSMMTPERLAAVVGGKLPIGKFVAIKEMLSYAQTLQTNIKCDAGEENAKAYIYLASSHADSGDATLFDFGIIRLGYDGGHVTKHQILKHGDSLKIDFLDKDGYVCIKNSDNKTFVSIFG